MCCAKLGEAEALAEQGHSGIRAQSCTATDRARATIAMQRLEHGDQSIAEIAHALGFSSAQSFHRSFKRWTGFTAAHYRRAVPELPEINRLYWRARKG